MIEKNDFKIERRTSLGRSGSNQEVTSVSIEL